MQVIAKKFGFYNNRRYRAGATFEFEGDKPASWMEPVGGDESKTEPKKDAGKKDDGKKGAATKTTPTEPQTLNEIAKADAKAAAAKGSEDLV